MRRQPAGPRRSRSVESYLRQTRILALVAVLAFVAAVVSDQTNQDFWARHSLLAGLVASLIVVMLTAGVVNEAIERRSRERWSILAQYVLFELVRNARMIWSGVMEACGLLPDGSDSSDWIEAGAEIVRDTPRLRASLRALVANADGRSRLHDEVAFLAEHGDEVLGRWASVMLNVAAYTEVMDRHVELAGDVAWIAGILDTNHPPDDPRRQRRARGSPSVQIESQPGPDWLADRMVIITQLAERLDSGTLELALRIVPVEWWQERLRGDLPGPPAPQPAQEPGRGPAPGPGA
jgi:hypothetical protein